MASNGASSREDPPSSHPLPRGSPPTTIVPSSDETAASSVSHSILSDYALQHHLAVQQRKKAPNNYLAVQVTPKVSDKYNPVHVTPKISGRHLPAQLTPKGSDKQHALHATPKVSNSYTARRSRQRGLQRSIHLQQALDRIQHRRSHEEQPESPCAKPEEVKELAVFLELFSRYDAVLDHLIRKNKKLRAYVKGRSNEYPSEMSLSSNDVQRTLEELRRQTTIAQGEKLTLSFPDSERSLQKTNTSGMSLRTSSIIDSDSNSLIDRNPTFSSTEPTTWARKGCSKKPFTSQFETSSQSEVELNTIGELDEPPDLYPITLTSSLDPPAALQTSSQRPSNRVRADPVGLKGLEETSSDEDTGRFKEIRFIGRYGEPRPASPRPILGDGQDSLVEPPRPAVIDLSLPDTDKMQRLKIHRAGLQKRALSRPTWRAMSTPTERPSTIKFQLPSKQEETEEAVAKPGVKSRSSVLAKLRGDIQNSRGKMGNPPSILVNRAPDAIARNAQKLREARLQRAIAPNQASNQVPSHAPSHHVTYHPSVSTGNNRGPPERTVQRQTGHFLPVSPTRVSEVQPFFDEVQSHKSSVAPSEEARRLQTQIDEVYAYSQQVRESQERLKTDLLNIKQRYNEGHKQRTRIVDTYRNHDSHEAWIDQVDSYGDLVNIGSADGSLGIFESNDGVIHIEEESLPSHNFTADMYRKNWSDYHVEEGVIFIDDDTLVKDPSVILLDGDSLRGDDKYAYGDGSVGSTSFRPNAGMSQQMNFVGHAPLAAHLVSSRNVELDSDLFHSEDGMRRAIDTDANVAAVENFESSRKGESGGNTLLSNTKTEIGNTVAAGEDLGSSRNKEQPRDMPQQLLSTTSTISSNREKWGTMESSKVQFEVDRSFDFYSEDDEYYGDDDGEDADDANSVAVVGKKPMGVEAAAPRKTRPRIDTSETTRWGANCGLPCGMPGF